MRTHDALRAALEAARCAGNAGTITLFGDAAGLGAEYALLAAQAEAIDCALGRMQARVWLGQIEQCVRNPAKPWPSAMAVMPKVPATLHGALVAFAEVARCAAVLRDRQRVLAARLRASLPDRPLLCLVPPPAPLATRDGPVGSWGGLEGEAGSEPGIWPAAGHDDTVRPVTDGQKLVRS